MKMIKRIAFLFLICCLMCSMQVLAEENDNKDNKEEAVDAFYTEMVKDAIRVLAETWNETYWDEAYPEKEYLLDIRNTRVVCIKEKLLGNAEEYFGDIRYIIEFLFYDDYFSFWDVESGRNAGYYGYSGRNDNIVVYADGRMECITQLIEKYRCKTYDSDLGPVVDQVIDLHDQFNQVIHFKNHQVIMEPEFRS